MGSDDLHVMAGLVIPGTELVESFSTSGGPGGQHANKVSTRVTVRFDIAASTALSEAQRERLISTLGPQMSVVVDEYRSQLKNRVLARERLAMRLRGALQVQRSRRPTRATRSSQVRRLDAKRRRSDTKANRQRPRTDD